MEEYFLHKCVTADAAGAALSSSPSLWSVHNRCEFVVVQEHRRAHGASRAVLASIVSMVAQSRKTSRVVVVTLECDSLLEKMKSNETHKTVVDHIDLSSDVTLFQAALIPGAPASPLLERVRERILQSVAQQPRDDVPSSSRPVVVVIDSINVLLQHHSLHQVLLLLHGLRKTPSIGSVIVRHNTSVDSKTIGQALAAEATALVVVETPSSLAAYSVLAKERRREIPKGMDGLVLLQRQKKNGRSTESVEFFQMAAAVPLKFVAATDATTDASAQAQPDDAATADGQKALPVRQEDVSFNIGMSAAERAAKSQVQLPYMQQPGTQAPPAAQQNLFFIDEDDPDWDDDDLDDDLDI
ncbi:TPA: hypothetical protein N0F65_012501 [Lagenidium giganteum]|uniref:Elongator complex protein 5 n=1 Tax=Lagenidium giganteum TaxID=4803 RepID=A0AAV2YQQ6_9STRA|nr:TPA: hypothetical protein N0F65_012501 [Lagenidium giganteum]